MEKNVFRFDVSVNDIVVMHKLNCMAHLLNDVLHSLFRKTAFLAHRCVDVASTARFEDEVEMVLVAEEGVKLGDIGVIEKALDFDLSDQLVDEPEFSFKYFFWYFFEGADKLCRFIST